MATSPNNQIKSPTNLKKSIDKNGNNVSGSTSQNKSPNTLVTKYDRFISNLMEQNNKDLSKMLYGYNTKLKGKDVVFDPTDSKSWTKYRPQAAINFSDIVDDHTIDGQASINSPTATPSSKYKFNPESEINGRSTTHMHEIERKNDEMNDASAMSVDMILGDSFVHEIRSMSQNKIDDGDRNSICNSLPSKYATASSMASKDYSWNRSCNTNPKINSMADSDSLSSESFVPFDQMGEKLLEDEKEWQNEFGDLPPIEASKPLSKIATPNRRNANKKIPGKLVNLTEFSGYLGDSNSAEYSTMSMGKYFSKRCEDIRDMIPNSSPTKCKPMALLSDSHRTASSYNTTADSRKLSEASTSFYTDDELKMKSLPIVNNATYEKKANDLLGNSVLSISDIAAKLNDESGANDSPGTFLSKLYKAKRSKTTKSLTGISEPTTSGLAKLNNAKRIIDMEKPMSNDVVTKNKPNNSNIPAGMLTRMNSTAIENKENQWNQNATADTESLCGSLNITDFNTDFSSTGYNSSMKETSPSKGMQIIENRPPKRSPNKNFVDVPQATTSKRMRSPNVDKKSRSPPINIPELQLNDLHLSPKNNRAQHQLSKDRDNYLIKSQDNQNEMFDAPRQFMVTERSSPVDGSKFSLPNYGLRGASRSMSNSPTAAVPIGRSSSQCSTNSEFSQNDGKFPLKANKSELVWECVKLRKSVNKSFVVKNSAHKRLTLKIEVVGPGFQISGSVQDQGSLVLQGNECRTISVTFCPTVIGKAIGKVIFKPTKYWPDEIERTVYLYGYGGHTTLQLQGIERGPVGISFLKMGETSNIRSTTLQRSFVIYNKGPLNGIATISLKPKTNQYIHETHITIEPNKCVIQPDSAVNISVSYKLRRKDLEKLSQKTCEVLTVATLEIIIGAEPNRKRLASMLTRTESIPTAYKSLDFLINDFPAGNDESFTEYNESLENVSDLFGCFKTSEVALTINRTTLDETRESCTDLSGIEESVFFRTLMHDPKNHDQRNDQFQTGYRPIAEESWSVYPTRLLMDQHENRVKTLFIQNNFHKEQTFQIDSNFRHLFTFTPNSGRINAGTEYKIDVEIKKRVYIPKDLVLTVYIESDCIEIPVFVKPAPPTYINHK